MSADTEQNPSRQFLATLVRGLRYDLGGRVFEVGIPRPCSSRDRDYLKRHAVIPAEIPGGEPMCIFDFVEDARSPKAAEDAFRLARVKAQNARLGDYTMPATVEAARAHSLDKRKDANA